VALNAMPPWERRAPRSSHRSLLEGESQQASRQAPAAKGHHEIHLKPGVGEGEERELA